MGWFSDIGAAMVPSRASTKTWMVVTFGLLVGLAVVAVSLYVVFVLRGETRDATHEILLRTAERVAVLVEQSDPGVDRQRVIRNVGRLTDLRITVASADSVYGDVQGTQILADGSLLERPEMQFDERQQVRFAEREDVQGRKMVYVALYRPISGLTVRIGQPEPPLFSLVERLQAGIIVGMLSALALAILGSWVAADQVTAPLVAIRNSARNISEGELDEKIQVNSRAAEFQDLAKSLNRMSDSFREQIEELHRLAELQNEFIGNVGHEVRNPIFAVSGYLEALGSSTLTPELRRRYAEKGLQNLHRLQNLFNDLIEIARLEYREDLIKATVFDLQELVEEVAEMLRPKAEAKGLNLEVGNPHLMVEADRNRIRQVVTNLMDNAIAYTDEGTVRCRFRRHLDKVRVDFIDTGRGIGEEHLDRIFERFYRVDPDRSRRSGGTGLGLSIVHQILHAHGEQAHVESTQGRGSRFWFELPYAHVEAVEPA